MAELPSGTVTFLFTDVEGSTRRWEEHPEVMQAAMARHDGLLRKAIESRGGHVFKTGGDAFFAVFSSAPNALAAALDGQRRIAAEDWGELGSLRVRMALHTGTAELRDGDYFGQPLNRAARLLSSGAGGQVLLSAATSLLVREHLPTGAELKDLGAHRFRDLAGPEHVSQLTHPDLPAAFPPLKSMDALPNNLPVQVTSFVGREKELAQVKEFLTTSRLLTLTGAGGSGKTRLSIQAAAALLERYPDGVWLVELAPLAQPELVPQAVATAMRLREEPGQPIVDTLVSAVGTRQVLLVLDNCEHLVEACARLVDTLARSCRNLTLLVTSREALSIAGETTWRVPSLETADPQQLPPAGQLAQHEAVRLLGQRVWSAVRKPSQATPHRSSI